MEDFDDYFELGNEVIEEITAQIKKVESKIAKRYQEKTKRVERPAETHNTGVFCDSFEELVQGNFEGTKWETKIWELPQVRENKLGADVAIEVSVYSVGNKGITVKTKTVLVQFKNDDNCVPKKDLKQAKDMRRTGRDSKFGIFSSKGIEIYDTQDIIKNDGSWEESKSEGKFSKILGSELLKCKVGTRDDEISQIKQLELVKGMPKDIQDTLRVSFYNSTVGTVISVDIEDEKVLSKSGRY